MPDHEVNMRLDETRQIADYWDRIAPRFDAIYSGKKNNVGRMLDRVFRRDMYQRFDWVMGKSSDVRGRSICDVGCGSGRFVSALAQRGATVTGLDFAPAMLQLAKQLVEQDVELMVEKTRAERQAGSKKKTPPPNSSWPKTRRSSS